MVLLFAARQGGVDGTRINAAANDPSVSPTNRSAPPLPADSDSDAKCAIASPETIPRDVSQADLERAIVGAVTAGAFDVARALAARLEARRQAANVVPLRKRRTG
jgi:hypothetical protein